MFSYRLELEIIFIIYKSFCFSVFPSSVTLASRISHVEHVAIKGQNLAAQADWIRALQMVRTQADRVCMHGAGFFLNALKKLSIEHDLPTQKHLRILREAQQFGEIAAIEEGFATAKRLLEARFLQYTSFLTKPPWNLVGLLEFILPGIDSQEDAIANSRKRASNILRAFDSGNLGNVGDVGEKFLKGLHRRALQRWAKGLDHFMNQQLYRELVGWASSLLVMQRLEAKHHLVHVAGTV